MNIPEGIEGCFEVVWNGVVVVAQEECHYWVYVYSCACGEIAEAPT